MTQGHNELLDRACEAILRKQYSIRPKES